MKALGKFLRLYLRGTFEPYFHIEEKGDRSNTFDLKLNEGIINDMCLRGICSLSRVRIETTKELSATTISLCLQTTSYPYSTNAHLPISGFPRELMIEDTVSPGT